MPDNKKHFSVWILLTLYFLSGVSSLAYEVLWVRMLSIQFGASIFAAVITVAAFMAGLGLGSFVGIKLSSSVKSPLLVFGILEIFIGLFSLLVPSIFSTIDPWLSGQFVTSDVSWWYGVYLVSALIILFVPAFVMGMGFPLVIRVLSHSRRGSNISLGKIYGINTLGGALGALLPLFLLPAFGWLLSLRLVVLVSLVIGFAVVFLGLRYAKLQEPTHFASQTDLSRIRISNLLLYAGIGAAALMLQIAWIRLFGMIFLRTEYVLAIILAVFLVGVALGSLLAKHLTHSRWFTLMPVLASSFSVLSLWLIPVFSAWIDKQVFTSLLDALLVEGSIIALLSLPVTLVFGAWLPLLNKKLCHNNMGGAWLYGANSVGAAMGALLAGFILIPAIGSSATLCLAAVTCFILGIIWSDNRKVFAYVIVLVIIALPVLDMPQVSVLQPGTQARTKDIYLYEDALAITHVVEKSNGQRILLSDLQRMDASTDPGSVVVQKNQARLPLILHANPQSILFLGLGTGISAAGSMGVPNLDRVAVEISKGAITAAREYFGEVNNHISQNMEIVHDDAKRYLINNSQRYDVIVGDLFHPDLVGRSALLSIQQFKRAYDHLNNDGVFVQWVALNQFDVKSLNIVLRTFDQVFDHSMLFVDAFRLALVGVRGKQLNAGNIMQHLQQLGMANANTLTGGEGGWTWLGRYWGEINVTQKGPIQDEWSPQIEFYLPKIRYHDDFSLAKMLAYLISQRPHINDAANVLAVDTADFEKFERSYIATDLAYRAWLALFEENPQEELRLFKLAYQANPKDRWVGFALADRLFASLKNSNLDEEEGLQAVLNVRDDHTQALLAMWMKQRKLGNTDAAQRYRERLKALDPLNIIFRDQR
ncbi:MAG: spermine synthase [Gammaproteobacteria bacterium]|nr:spermine synthase [Gammaproteobacteria bacterium]